MSQPIMTHSEACRMVEDSLERAVNTLAYIRAKLAKPMSDGQPRQLSMFDEMRVEHANMLCNINWYGAFLKGAKAMYRALEHELLLSVEPKEKGVKAPDRRDRIKARADLDLYMSSARNMEWLLFGRPNTVELFTRFTFDKKGKVIGAKSKFVKKEVQFKEV